MPLSQQLHRQLPSFLWIGCHGAARPGHSGLSSIPTLFLLCSQQGCYSWTLCYPQTRFCFCPIYPCPVSSCASAHSVYGRPGEDLQFLHAQKFPSQSWKVLFTATSQVLTLLPANPFPILQANLLSMVHHLPLWKINTFAASEVPFLH